MVRNSLLIVLACVCFIPLSGRSATLTVTSTTDAGMGSLRQIVSNSNPGDTILFSPSTDGTPIVLISGEILIQHDLTIIGNGTSQTLIEGNSTQRIFNVFNTSITLESLNLSNGFSASGGGAMVAFGSTLILNAIVFSNNFSQFQGGALLLTSCNTEVTACEFVNNQVDVPLNDYGGGAIRNHGGRLTIENSLFSFNEVINGGIGGSILNDSTAALTITGCTFSNNQAVKAGGAIADISDASSTSSITASNFNDNFTSGSSSAGGALLLGNGDLTLRNSAFENNRTSVEGGAIWIGMGHLLLDNCQLNGNLAGGDVIGGRGGAIYLNQGSLNIENGSTLSQNAAIGLSSFGGGIYVDSSGLLIVKQSSIINNSAEQAGGGIADNSDNSNSTLIENSLIENNRVLGISSAAGGILLGSGNMTLSSSSVNGNQSSLQGGGIWIGSGTVLFEKAQVKNNTTGGDNRGLGGGVFIRSGMATFLPSTEISNNASDGAGSLGGGVYIDAAGAYTMEGTRITNNESYQGGGGIADNSSGVKTNIIIKSVIDSNRTIGPTSAAGGILLGNGKMELSEGSVSHNQSSVQGGGIWTFAGKITLDNVIIENNATGSTAYSSGGGVYSKNGDLSIINNCSLIGNTALGSEGLGGGIFIEAKSNLHIDNCFISNNLAFKSGGAIADISDASSRSMILKSRIENNLAVGPQGAAGAILLGNGSMTIDNSFLTGNNAATQGGCIWLDSASLSIQGSEITNNNAGGMAQGMGGGIYNNAGQLSIEDNCKLSGNIATGPNSLAGGLYSGASTNLSISGSLVSDNRSAFGGGIVTILDSNKIHSIKNTTITQNMAIDSFGFGGGLTAYGTGKISIDSCKLTKNTARFRGAGIWNAVDSLQISYSTLDSNNIEGLQQGNGGGGIFNAAGKIKLEASTVSHNISLDVGGGIWNSENATVEIERSTLSHNSSSQSGGGIYNVGALSIRTSTIAFNNAPIAAGGIYHSISDSALSDTSYTLLHSNIVAENQAGSLGNDIYSNMQSIQSAGYNLIGSDDLNAFQATTGDLVGTAAMPVEAALEPLMDNGGLTQTHAINCESPAINSGDPDINNVDQRSEAVFDGRRDIGAYEYQDTCATTSLSDNYKTDKLILYPNPVRDGFVSIGLSELLGPFSKIEIINTATGKVMLSKASLQAGKIIDVTPLPPGHYLLKAEQNGRIAIGKLVVIR